MTDTQRVSNEVLEAELELHKTEFVTLREEMLRSMDAERQSLNLSLIAAGAGLSLAPFLLGPQTYIVLLLLPLVFHVLLWEMLNAIRTVSRLSSYLTSILVPRVNVILDELGSQRKGTLALGWEVHIATLAMGRKELILTSLTPTRHWMPILAIAGLMIAYAILIGQAGYTPTPSELGLILLNLVLLMWAAIQNIVTLRGYMQATRGLKPVSPPKGEQIPAQPKDKPKAGHSKK